MSLADRSYATRYAQQRARILAIQYNNARLRGDNTPQVGPGGIGVSDSDRATRALGQRRIWRERNPTGCTGTLPEGLLYSVNPPSQTEQNRCCSLTANGGPGLAL
jgi:hypothetical protein